MTENMPQGGGRHAAANAQHVMQSAEQEAAALRRPASDPSRTSQLSASLPVLDIDSMPEQNLGVPVITFDPADGSEVNTGYVLTVGPDGRRQVEEVLVDEKMAQERPVWVVNRNDDSEFASLEMLRREDPDWGTAGGDLIVGTKAEGEESIRTLILKSFTANRNFDPWFAGASEFFVKCGSVENFKAKTEADLLLYTPSVTDFMIVVKRSQVGSPVPFNAVLISQWTDHLSTCAFMIHEDDGGTWTAWNCKIEGKMQSKTTGIDISIPFRSRDDIVWRGQLTSKYFEHYDDVKGHFGDVDITFALQKR